jgi:hypothetical protein
MRAGFALHSSGNRPHFLHQRTWQALRFCHSSFVRTTTALDMRVVMDYLNQYER